MQIIPRSQWAPRYRAGFGTRTVGRLDKFLHHSVTAYISPNATLAQEAAVMRTLEAIGQQRFGGGISYTHILFPSGRIWEGLPVNRIGAHTKGHNTSAVALVLVGNYETHEPTPQMVTAAAAWLDHGVRQGWWTQRKFDGGHRDVRPGTACPGRHAYRMLPTINKLAQTGTSTLENLMALSKSDLEAIALAVWGYKNDKVNGPRDAYGLLTDAKVQTGPIARGGKAVSLRQEVADAKTGILALQGTVAGLSKALEQIGKGQSVDLAAVRAAAEEGVSKAIAGIKADVTVSIEEA